VTLKNIAIIMIMVTAGFLYFTFFGERPDSLISDVLLTKDKNSRNLQLDFASPVRHIGHFPENEGDILQIKLRAISFHDFPENISILKKYLQSAKAIDYNIEDIRYEGNVPGGPLVIIKFTQPVTFQINEGDGLKAMLINYKLI
jgi:hypothetical protein